jgi:hypothetical protein
VTLRSASHLGRADSTDIRPQRNNWQFPTIEPPGRLGRYLIALTGHALAAPG